MGFAVEHIITVVYNYFSGGRIRGDALVLKRIKFRAPFVVVPAHQLAVSAGNPAHLNDPETVPNFVISELFRANTMK